MQVAAPGAGRKPDVLKKPVKLVSILSLLLLLAACALVALNAWSPSGVAVGAAEAASAGAGVLGLAALASGLWMYTRTRPQMVAPVLFVLLLTGVVLGAHLYIINNPPAYVHSSLSGATGDSFSDQQVTVDSALAGRTLSVTIHATGSDAVAGVNLTLDGAPLSPQWPASSDSLADPLQPPNLVSTSRALQGNWTVSGNGTLTVAYDDITCYHPPSSGSQTPGYGCIMDEAYYVPSAQGLLAGQQCSQGEGYCNLEHPFLAKALIAAGMAIFGQFSALGWRFFVMLTGVLSIPLAFALAYLITGSRKLSYLSALFLAADTMVFVQSSAALIDVPSLFFTLLAFVFYFWRGRFWKVDTKVAAGVFLGLAVLCKETAVFAVAALATYEAWSSKGSARQSVLDMLKILAVSALVFIAGLQVFDSLFTSAQQPWFYEQIRYIFTYGSSLTCPPFYPPASACGAWTSGLFGRYINPLDWITFFTPVGYFVTSVTTTISSGASSQVFSYPAVAYWGTANVLVVWMLYAWVPTASSRLVKGWRRKVELSRDDTAAGFALVWFLWSFLPYVALWAYGRVTYPFYLIPAVPALALGTAYLTSRDWFPRVVAVVYVAAALVWFFLYFPVKDFLPVWLRALIGR